MSSNKLKIIACICMICDHINVLLFPQIMLLRYIGRLSMPIFSYFIAEGCIHTRSKLKYFLQVLLLALICQIFYFAESLINGNINTIDLNILFTLALSIIICNTYLNMVQNKTKINILYFTISIMLSIFLCVFINHFLPIDINFDYGIMGVLLPLFAVIFKDKKYKIPLFVIGLILFNLPIAVHFPYTWYSLLAIPLLLLYNGKRGTHKLKYFFYLFYPVHFATIYLISLLI